MDNQKNEREDPNNYIYVPELKNVISCFLFWFKIFIANFIFVYIFTLLEKFEKLPNFENWNIFEKFFSFETPKIRGWFYYYLNLIFAFIYYFIFFVYLNYLRKKFFQKKASEK